MPCAHPIPAVRTAFGGVALARERDYQRHEVEWGLTDGQLLLPCGSCLGCQMSRAREWAFRCSLEFNDHTATCWTTLTYAPEHVPPTLRKKHLSAFLKKLRKAMSPQRVRFFGSGEYGERNGRPHYHVILFGMSDSPEIQASWRYGHVKTFPLSPALIAYTAGYCVKKVGHKELQEERLDRSTGELYKHQPPFILMSRKPGIGGSARVHRASWRKEAIYNNNPIPVPRFLHKAWLDTATPLQIQHLNQEKSAVIRDTSRERLRASELIAASKLKSQAELRPL